MNTENHSQTAAFLWSIADLLRGDCRNRTMIGIFGADGPFIPMSLQQLDRCPKWVLIEIVLILRQRILSGGIKSTQFPMLTD